MKKFFDNFEKVFASAAFAETGEFETAGEILESNKNAHKNVLLVTNGEEISQNAINHAVNLCKRVGTNLEIIHSVETQDSELEKELYQQKKEKLQSILKHFNSIGVGFELHFDFGRFPETFIEKIKNRCDIFCVVLSATKQQTSGRKSNHVKKLQTAFQGYGYPLVVIT